MLLYRNIILRYSNIAHITNMQRNDILYNYLNPMDEKLREIGLLH